MVMHSYWRSQNISCKRLARNPRILSVLEGVIYIVTLPLPKAVCLAFLHRTLEYRWTCRLSAVNGVDLTLQKRHQTKFSFLNSLLQTEAHSA